LKRGGILPILLVIGVFFISNTISVKAGDELVPDFEDKRNDCFEYWDILSAWFHESESDSNELQISIQMHEITLIGRTQLIVDFICDNTKCYVNTTISFFGIPHTTINIHQIQWKSYPIQSNIDFEKDIITCKIPKDICDDFRCGTMITDACIKARYVHCDKLNQHSMLSCLLQDIVYGKEYTLKY